MMTAGAIILGWLVCGWIAASMYVNASQMHGSRGYISTALTYVALGPVGLLIALFGKS